MEKNPDYKLIFDNVINVLEDELSEYQEPYYYWARHYIDGLNAALFYLRKEELKSKYGTVPDYKLIFDNVINRLEHRISKYQEPYYYWARHYMEGLKFAFYHLKKEELKSKYGTIPNSEMCILIEYIDKLGLYGERLQIMCREYEQIKQEDLLRRRQLGSEM